MTWKRSILVVANVTATSEALLNALEQRAEREPISVTLIIPATAFGGGIEAATVQLKTALDSLNAHGIEAEGSVGDGDPIVAIDDAWDPRRFDEIVISTLPEKESKWLRHGLTKRVAELTGAAVSHVVATLPKAPVQTVTRTSEEDNLGIAKPLAGLWRRG
jgi:hypothetical protein